MANPERKYAMTRLPKGYGYVLPSNDGETLWWIRRYYEEGSLIEQLENGRERRIVGWFWEAVRFRGTVADWQATVDRMRGWDDLFDFLIDERRWETYHWGLRTRQEAVESALSRDVRTGGNRVH